MELSKGEKLYLSKTFTLMYLSETIIIMNFTGTIMHLLLNNCYFCFKWKQLFRVPKSYLKKLTLLSFFQNIIKPFCSLRPTKNSKARTFYGSENKSEMQRKARKPQNTSPPNAAERFLYRDCKMSQTVSPGEINGVILSGKGSLNTGISDLFDTAFAMLSGILELLPV